MVHEGEAARLPGDLEKGCRFLDVSLFLPASRVHLSSMLQEGELQAHIANGLLVLS